MSEPASRQSAMLSAYILVNAGCTVFSAENRDMFTSLLAVSLNSASRGQCRTAGSSQDTLWVQFTYRPPGPEGGLQPHGILDLFFPTKTRQEIKSSARDRGAVPD